MNKTITRTLVGLAAIATVGLGASCSKKEATAPQWVNVISDKTAQGLACDIGNDGEYDVLRFRNKMSLPANVAAYGYRVTWAHTDYVLNPVAQKNESSSRIVDFNGENYAPIVKDVSPEFFVQFKDDFTGTIDETHVQKTWDNYDAMRVDLANGYVTPDSE